LQTSPSGILVANVEAKRGQVVVITSDAYEGGVYDPDSRIGGGYDHWGPFVAQETGTYRVHFEAEKAKATSFEAEVDVLDPRPAARGAKVSRVRGQQAGAWTVDFDNTYYGGNGDEDYEVLDPKGEDDFYDETLSGRYVVVVRSDNVDLVPTGPSFEDGGTSYSGTVDSDDTVSVGMRLEAGEPVSITGSADEDISLTVDGDTADDNVEGAESLTFTPDTSGRYTVEVYNFGSSTSSFTLDLS
jgi:hypothetical protein